MHWCGQVEIRFSNFMLLKEKFKPSLVSSVLLVSVLFMLTACGGGSGSSAEGADPGVLEVPVAFIKRPIPTDNQGQPVQLDFRDPRFFTEGGDVYLRDNSSVVAQEINVTAAVTKAWVMLRV